MLYFINNNKHNSVVCVRKEFVYFIAFLWPTWMWSRMTVSRKSTERKEGKNQKNRHSRGCNVHACVQTHWLKIAPNFRRCHLFLSALSFFVPQALLGRRNGHEVTSLTFTSTGSVRCQRAAGRLLKFVHSLRGLCCVWYVQIPLSSDQSNRI